MRESSTRQRTSFSKCENAPRERSVQQRESVWKCKRASRDSATSCQDAKVSVFTSIIITIATIAICFITVMRTISFYLSYYYWSIAYYEHVITILITAIMNVVIAEVLLLPIYLYSDNYYWLVLLLLAITTKTMINSANYYWLVLIPAPPPPHRLQTS